jgi:hypothetical protein
MKIASDLEQALVKLAKSVRGKQGIGIIKSPKTAMKLFQIGYVRPVRSQDDNVCAVTLDGFRYLQARDDD